MVACEASWPSGTSLAEFVAVKGAQHSLGAPALLPQPSDSRLWKLRSCMGRAPGLKYLPQPAAAHPSRSTRGGRLGRGGASAGPWTSSDFNQEPVLVALTPSLIPDKP